MNSSGIKRGLAATAVAALAVTGLPFLASSASAAPAASDTLAQGATGPIRNGNADGGVVTIKSNNDTLVATNLYVTPADFSGTPKQVDTDPGDKELTSSAFDVDIIGLTLLDGDTTNAPGTFDKFADGLYHYELQTAVTLGSATKATFGLVEDLAPVGSANASDPKTVVEVTPTGAPAAVDVTAASPVTTEGNPVTFNVEVKDAAGNLTQLVSGEEFDVTASAGSTPSVATLDDSDLNDGKASFTATPGIGSADTMTVTVTGSTPPAATITDSASVSVFDNAEITNDEFDLVSGADNWVAGTTDFGDAGVQVRVDQDKVTFSFQSKDSNDADTTPDDAGKVVGLVLKSATIKFDGKAAPLAGTGYIAPVVLDGAGKGSVTVALSDVTAGSSFTFAGPGSSIAETTVTMNRASANTVASDAKVYVTKVGSPTAVTVTVKDQFGNPIGAPAQVSITRTAAPNAGTSARVTVDASGKATINLPDAGNTAGRAETFTINLYQDQFAADPIDSVAGGGYDPFTGGTINYTADGLGGDFNVAGATSDATLTVISPLWDDNAGGGAVSDDVVTIDIGNVTAGTANAPAKVTVDNGALILTSGETTLDKGASSEAITLSGGGAGQVKVVGTKTGVVTVTVESAGRTKTVKFTVAKQDATEAAAAARNVDLTAPEKATAGDVAVFTAKVTDAFGNPIAGVSALNFVVSGPANVQSQDAVTDANGELKANVLLTDNANSQVKVTVTATGSQFGSKANEISGAPAPGLSASQNSDSATVTDVVNIAELEAAVAEAQEKVDNAQDVVDAATDNLAIAKAERSVAQREVKAAKADLKKAKRQGKGVAAARAALREARGELRIATAKVNAAQAAYNRASARLAAAQAQLEAAEQALEDAQNS